jgi:hypothetical protein
MKRHSEIAHAIEELERFLNVVAPIQMWLYGHLLGSQRQMLIREILINLVEHPMSAAMETVFKLRALQHHREVLRFLDIAGRQ